MAPNLEELEADVESEDLELLPSGLTELRIAEHSWYLTAIMASQLPCTWLRSLRLPGRFDCAELPRLVGALTGLTRLEMTLSVIESKVPQLLESLDNGREDLGLYLSSATLNGSSPALERLFRHLVEVKSDRLTGLARRGTDDLNT